MNSRQFQGRTARTTAGGLEVDRFRPKRLNLFFALKGVGPELFDETTVLMIVNMRTISLPPANSHYEFLAVPFQ